jgi:hypothetical protein
LLLLVAARDLGIRRQVLISTDIRVMPISLLCVIVRDDRDRRDGSVESGSAQERAEQVSFGL